MGNTKNNNQNDQNWQLSETKFSKNNNPLYEALFSLGNGYLGIRATHDEGLPNEYKAATQSGVFINGLSELHPITYPESAYGWPKKGEYMLNIASGKDIELWIDNESLQMGLSKILDYNRTLDMQKGILTRSLIWETCSGKKIKVISTHMVSLVNDNLILIKYELTPLNFSGKVIFKSYINSASKAQQTGDDPRVGTSTNTNSFQVIKTNLEDSFISIHQKAELSHQSVVCGIRHHGSYCKQDLFHEEDKIGTILELDLQKRKTHNIEKHIAYVATIDALEDDLHTNAIKVLDKAQDVMFEGYLDYQLEYLSNYWRLQDIQITGNQDIQVAIRFALFHMLQSVGKNGKTSIAAKGLTGEGYGGHYFWDAEMYALPCFLFSSPNIVKSMLSYRYQTLDKAKERAFTLGYKGALFPWRTITGLECSAYFPSGTAAFHINADIIYAAKSYFEATHDYTFLHNEIAEITIESARLYYSLGHFNPGYQNQFCIFGVTGPDEYTTLVNNNYYTNKMAQMTFDFANDIIKSMQSDQMVFKKLKEKLSLHEEEVKQWQNASKNMYLGVDEKLGIIKQDDSFLTKPRMAKELLRKAKRPIFLHQHYLNIYRAQVSKQADATLALSLFREDYSDILKQRSLEYYDKVTTHDSSLSMCTSSLLASDVGQTDKAYNYFLDSVSLDINNTHGNTADGVHIANMGGAWQCIIYGFAGLKFIRGKLIFNPVLPRQWDSYQFKLQYQGSLLQIKIEQNLIYFNLLNKKTINFYYKDKKISLSEANQFLKIETKSCQFA